jgi:hypothetical protein
MLLRYRYALEQSLLRLNFLNEPSITTLQAFTLYLITARYAPLSLPGHVLLAIAIRLAISLNLHRDPFEDAHIPNGTLITVALRTDVELRCRLWWNLLALDVRMAEDSGTDPVIMDFIWSTKKPTNIDDEELDLTDERPVVLDTNILARNDEVEVTPNYRTKMMFPLMSLELAHLTRRLSFSKHFCETNGYEYITAVASKKDKVTSLKKCFDEQYLQYCSKASDNFAFFERNAVNLLFGRILMIISDKDGQERETLHNAVQMIEAAGVLRTCFPKWGWLLRPYVELDTMMVLWKCLEKLPSIDQINEEELNSPNAVELRHAWALASIATKRTIELFEDGQFRDRILKVKEAREKALEVHPNINIPELV